MKLLGSLLLAALFVTGCGSDTTTSTASPTRDAGADTALDTGTSDGALDGSTSDSPITDAIAPDAQEASTDQHAPLDAAKALEAYAKAVCTTHARCSPYMVRLMWGSESGCVARYLAGGMSAVLPTGPGVVRSPEDLVSCGEAWKTLQCEDVYAGRLPCRQLKGSLAENAACFAHMQCASGFCERTSDCGTCKPQLTEGQECDTVKGGCAEGLTCWSPSIEQATKCTKLGTETGPCGTVACQGALWCNEGTCAQPIDEGSPCNATPTACNRAKGLACINGECSPAMLFASTGQACGPSGTSYYLCDGTSYCDANTKKCVAKSNDNTACSEGAVNACLYFASCEKGTCVTDSEPTCP